MLMYVAPAGPFFFKQSSGSPKNVKCAEHFTHPQAIPDVDEFVSSTDL